MKCFQISLSAFCHSTVSTTLRFSLLLTKLCFVTWLCRRPGDVTNSLANQMHRSVSYGHSVKKLTSQNKTGEISSGKEGLDQSLATFPKALPEVFSRHNYKERPSGRFSRAQERRWSWAFVAGWIVLQQLLFWAPSL